jgi:hypothetical protein
VDTGFADKNMRQQGVMFRRSGYRFARQEHAQSKSLPPFPAEAVSGAIQFGRERL